ncbi:MAG: hypothetical protein IT405_03075 [Candidatus Yanofskybacteria bacterium]|nr:hypothetical protein [Candidatus Yanofskybacteria bacterium]
MTTIIPISTPAVAPTSAPQTSTSTESVAEMAKCSRTGCGWSFGQGEGFVPELKKLYQQARPADFAGADQLSWEDLRRKMKAKPLTREEILKAELCRRCGQRMGFRTFRTEGTIALMERWVQENKTRDEQFRSQRSLGLAIANQDRGINAILAEGHRERRHHKKLSRRQQREAAALKHRAPKPEEGRGKKKNKKGGDKQKGGGKGKKK